MLTYNSRYLTTNISYTVPQGSNITYIMLGDGIGYEEFAPRWAKLACAKGQESWLKGRRL